MPRCAACLLDLRPKEQFTLVEQFVIHRACAGRAIKLADELRQAQQAQRDLAALVERAEASERISRIAFDRVQRERDDARAEAAGERSRRTAAELQLELARGAPPAQPIRSDAPATEPGSDTPEKDAAEIRFGLLELA